MWSSPQSSKLRFTTVRLRNIAKVSEDEVKVPEVREGAWECVHFPHFPHALPTAFSLCPYSDTFKIVASYASHGSVVTSLNVQTAIYHAEKKRNILGRRCQSYQKIRKFTFCQQLWHIHSYSYRAFLPPLPPTHQEIALMRRRSLLRSLSCIWWATTQLECEGP